MKLAEASRCRRSDARCWEVVAAVAALLPRPRLVEHWDEFDGAVLLLSDQHTPQRRLRLDPNSGLELLAEQLFAPMPWDEVRALGVAEVAQRVVRSMGHTPQGPRPHFSSAVAALLLSCEVPTVRMRSATPLTLNGLLLLPEVTKFAAVLTALTDAFEAGVNGCLDFEPVEAWLVFQNERAVAAITCDGTQHLPA